jgi:uncharacterized protein (TIGR02597 family)
MKTIPLLPRLIAIAAAAAPVGAQTTGGATALTIKGASDSRLSLPYQQPRVDGGTVAGVTATSLVLAGETWIPGQFTRQADGTGKVCYALFLDGPLEGVFYKVLSNNEDTLVLDTEGDKLNEHPLGAIPFGTRVDIVPYWTVAEVFGADEASVLLEPRVSPLFPTDDLLLYDNGRSGINKAPVTTIYYRKNQGWRSVAAPSDSSAETILPPGAVFTVRRRGATDLELINFGVYYRQRRAVFVAGGATEGNDQYVSLLLPEPVTLDESNLSNGVVRPSASPLLRADEVLVWRSANPGFNQAPDTVLYYRPAIGWLKVGDNTPLGSSFSLAPGEAIIIRKKPSSPPADWLQIPPP